MSGGLADDVAAVGLDERLVDALGLEPGDENVAERGLTEAVMPAARVSEG